MIDWIKVFVPQISNSFLLKEFSVSMVYSYVYFRLDQAASASYICLI